MKWETLVLINQLSDGELGKRMDNMIQRTIIDSSVDIFSTGYDDGHAKSLAAILTTNRQSKILLLWRRYFHHSNKQICDGFAIKNHRCLPSET